MRFSKKSNYIKFIIVISIPILLIAQYYLFKTGVFKPMVKGIEVSITNGDYIQDLDKITIKLNEEITLDSGNYITIPQYSKEPKIWFKELDEDNILQIKDNKITGLKEGIASVGIMKDSRVLKKINIKVVKQKVLNLTVTTNNDINYVGDSTEIDAKVDVHYDRFKEKEDIYYISSNENILNIEKNKIKAVGVGKANILIKSGDIEKILSYNIIAKIANIKIDKVIELSIGETKKLNPQIITSPKGLKYGQIKYELVDSKLPVERAISINKDGTIIGLKNGQEKIKISCGNKSKIITIKVTNEQENKIQNISWKYEIANGKAIITLVWDYINNINKYGVYIKNNSLGEENYSLIDTINISSIEELESNKVKTNIELELINETLPDINIYIVGITDKGEIEPSDIINIKPKDILDESVEDLVGKIEDNNIKLSWKTIDIENTTYSIYIKDNLNKESGFVLYQNGIQQNEYSIPTYNKVVDIDVYVIGSKDGKNSNHSKVLNIKNK